MAADEPPRIKLRAHMLTDVGVVRDHNEDSAFIDDRMEFFVVADGMGGHAAGEVASQMAVDRVRQHLEEARESIENFGKDPTEDGRKSLVSLLETAVRQAHQAVYERGAKETDKQGMGTTLDVVLLAGAEAFVAHVGDSRTYLMRDGKAAQITTDHTVAEVLVIEGKLSMEEAQVSPLRTILVNAIGVAPDVGVEMAHLRLRQGDKLLLCSDGLHDYFPVEQELADQIQDRTPDEALVEMIDLAKDRGGHDNITGVLLEILEAPPPRRSSDTARVSDGVPEGITSDDTMPVEELPKKAVLKGKGDDDNDETADDEASAAASAELASKRRRENKDTVRIRALSKEEKAKAADKPKKKKKKKRSKKSDDSKADKSGPTKSAKDGDSDEPDVDPLTKTDPGPAA